MYFTYDYVYLKTSGEPYRILNKYTVIIND